MGHVSADLCAALIETERYSNESMKRNGEKIASARAAGLRGGEGIRRRKNLERNEVSCNFVVRHPRGGIMLLHEDEIHCGKRTGYTED